MKKLPDIFKPILWSYDFEKCDPLQMEKTIIVASIEYGSMKHWKWIRSFYGDAEIKNVLSRIPITEIRPKTRTLVETIFGFNNWNYAPRGAK